MNVLTCGSTSISGVTDTSWGWDYSRLTWPMDRVISNLILIYIQFWTARDVKIESLNVRLDINIKNKQTLVDIRMRVDWPAYGPGYKQSSADIYSVIHSEKNLIITTLNKFREQTLNAFQHAGCNWRISTCNSTLTSKND